MPQNRPSQLVHLLMLLRRQKVANFETIYKLFLWSNELFKNTKFSCLVIFLITPLGYSSAYFLISQHCHKHCDVIYPHPISRKNFFLRFHKIFDFQWDLFSFGKKSSIFSIAERIHVNVVIKSVQTFEGRKKGLAFLTGAQNTIYGCIDSTKQA